jgi:hypothetical protein
VRHRQVRLPRIRQILFPEQENPMRRAISALSASIFLAGTIATATAAEPVGGSAFNVKAKVDLKALDSASFEAMLTPVAKTEGGSELVFYDFADTLCDLLAKESEGIHDRDRNQGETCLRRR